MDQAAWPKSTMCFTLLCHLGGRRGKSGVDWGGEEVWAEAATSGEVGKRGRREKLGGVGEEAGAGAGVGSEREILAA